MGERTTVVAARHRRWRRDRSCPVLPAARPAYGRRAAGARLTWLDRVRCGEVYDAHGTFVGRVALPDRDLPRGCAACGAPVAKPATRCRAHRRGGRHDGGAR